MPIRIIPDDKKIPSDVICFQMLWEWRHEQYRDKTRIYSIEIVFMYLFHYNKILYKHLREVVGIFHKAYPASFEGTSITVTTEINLSRVWRDIVIGLNPPM